MRIYPPLTVEELRNLFRKEEVNRAFVAKFRERVSAQVKLLGGVFSCGCLLGEGDYLFRKGAEAFA